jgi:hypothetical protein
MTLDIETGTGGRLSLSTLNKHEPVLLARADAPPGRNTIELTFDLAESLPMGIGRVARYNETYHETNLAWMWHLSAFGAEKRCAFVARRWLYSFLTGNGRLPLAGAPFNVEKLVESQQEPLQLIRRQGASCTLPSNAAAQAKLRAIDEILSLANPTETFSLSHTTPEIIGADRDAIVSVYGFGFDGSERVELLGRDGAAHPLLPTLRSGDEILLSLDMVTLGKVQGEQATIRIRRDGAAPQSVDLRIRRI